MVFPWAELLLFMAAVLLLALYGLTASGHFPLEFRAEKLKNRKGAMIIWATMVAACLAGAGTLIAAWTLLPWYAVVIGGGAMLLAAPLLLQQFPDSFVDGRAGLATFAAAGGLAAVLLWAAA